MDKKVDLSKLQKATVEANKKEGFSDPLLDCLVILTHLNEKPFSARALTAGLPLEHNRLTPQLFTRAAQRAGYSTRIVKRPLERISQLILPAVLLLKNARACILHKIIDDKTVEIVSPETGGGVARVDISDLEADYTGFAIFMKPTLKFDKRADQFEVAEKKSWFWGTLWNYRRIYGQVMLAALLINLFAIAMPLFIMNVYDRVVPNFAVETLWVLAIGVAVVIGFDLLLRTLRGYLIDVAGKKADTILASTLFQQVMNVEMGSKPASSGAFASNIREFEVLRDFFASASVATLVDLPFVLLFIAIIWAIGGGIALIPLLAVPIVFCCSYFLEIPIRRAVEKAVFGSTQKHAILVEAINGLETIKSAGAEGTMQRKWEQYVGEAAHAGLESRLFSTLAINLTAFISHIITVAIVVTGVYMIADNMLTVGGLIACVILNGRAIAPLAQLAALITRYNQSRIALKGLNRVMELPVERSSEKKYLHKPSFTSSIEFHNVSFSYPGQEKTALDNISLSIEIGERVAILGNMGSGKSTLQKLLLNLYAPTSGAILVDGIDLAQIDPADLRHNIGYVSQDYSMLYGTVHENIALSMPWANDQMVVRAAQMAGVDKFVSQHPAGFAMPVGEQGAGISGGQRQSVAIARAIISNPMILLLDEPTSSIDASAEQLIVRNLAQYAAKRTLVIATHKMSMLDLVERVIVLDKGKVIADGPKDEIVGKFTQQSIIIGDQDEKK